MVLTWVLIRHKQKKSVDGVGLPVRYALLIFSLIKCEVSEVFV